VSSSDVPAAAPSAAAPRVLFVYFTYTQQSLKVVEAMAAVLRERGCDVRQAAVEFTDKRWAERFTRFPLRHAYLDVLGMAPAQLRGATGDIQIPADAREGDYDFVCIGSPTWFFRPSVPIRSFLKSDEAGRLLKSKRFAAFVVCRRYWSVNLREVRKLGTKQGGEYVNGTHFSFAGGQVRSLLSLLSFFGKGEDRERYLGVKIPPSNLKPDYGEQARAFANEVADGLERRSSERVSASSARAPDGQPKDTVRGGVA
jgi:menaquinone-dependent protoporphyrinogen IX oxidase